MNNVEKDIIAKLLRACNLVLTTELKTQIGHRK